jgi:hypothetical protein
VTFFDEFVAKFFIFCVSSAHKLLETMVQIGSFLSMSSTLLSLRCFCISKKEQQRERAEIVSPSSCASKSRTTRRKRDENAATALATNSVTVVAFPKDGINVDDATTIQTTTRYRKQRHEHHHRRREFFFSSFALVLATSFMSPRAMMNAEADEEKEGGNPSETLQPLQTYKNRLRRVERELSAIVSSLRDDAEGTTGGIEEAAAVTEDEFDLRQFSGVVSKADLDAIRKALHENELGNFWEIALGANRYLNGSIKSDFARGEEDLWKLAPKKSEAISNFLTPDFNNADDKLCLIYSCVNDPSAPPSIDVLYALKLFDEGLKEASKKGKKNVTRDGLREVAKDALEKLLTYERLIEREAEDGKSDASWKNPAFGKGWHGTGI